MLKLQAIDLNGQATTLEHLGHGEVEQALQNALGQRHTCLQVVNLESGKFTTFLKTSVESLGQLVDIWDKVA
jgi:hypothetical protein